jgi:hypothetical protein
LSRDIGLYREDVLDAVAKIEGPLAVEARRILEEMG